MAASAQQDDLAVAQNGGLVAQDNTEDVDMDGEEGDLDDDMMDKISSSPSIDDGGSTCELPFFDKLPQPDASPGSSPASASEDPSFSEAKSSSPYLNLPDYLPIQRTISQHSARGYIETPFRHHHHLPGAFPVDPDEQTSDDEVERGVEMGTEQNGISRAGSRAQRRRELACIEEMDSYSTADEMMDVAGFEEQLEKEHMDVDEVVYEMSDEDDDDDGLILSYEDTTDEDDDDDFFLESTDGRFIDSGWGGECLHDTEDIDFELVYALHTFIATVEGQANATKGDAMVLLDDSNSYWWLVRVVKDSSIGEAPSVDVRGKRSDLTNCRIPAGRAHRNAHRTTRSFEQTPKH